MDALSLETGPGHARAEWEALAAAVLRKSGRLDDDEPDAEVWARLTRRTLDGLEITPLGTPDVRAGMRTAGRPTRVGDWDVRALFADPDVDTTRSAILTDLENGVSSVWLQLGDHAVPTAELAGVLEPVLLDAAAVVLDAPGDQLGAARAFAELAGGRELADGTNLGVDPVGAMLRDGGFEALPPGLARAGTSTTATRAAELAGELGCRALVVDGTVVHDLGASDVQELGYVLAVGAHYLRALTGAGLGAAEAAGLLEFRLAATDEQFPTIAKLRAVRRLWARALELSGVTAPVRVRIHAVTSRPMMSKYDPWVNMLRTCVAAFSAAVGGADAITVLPFDAPLGLPDAFSRRIARNTSTVLFAESHLSAVADPAGGSHLVEKLTDDTAVAAWAELGRIDGVGDLAGLADLQRRIEAIAAERDRQVATRRRAITGLSEFPNLHETLPERTPYPAGGVPVRSYGHAFEALRDEPVAQRVFLATMGTVAAHTARATFATNLLAAGGIDVVNEGAHDDVDAVLAHYSGEPVVCLAGTDAAYTEWGGALVHALRDAGARWIIVAGRPMEGADDNCAMGLDALDFLTRTREKLA
jgi:methylmalonyl-CoA mutase